MNCVCVFVSGKGVRTPLLLNQLYFQPRVNVQYIFSRFSIDNFY